MRLSLLFLLASCGGSAGGAPAPRLEFASRSVTVEPRPVGEAKLIVLAWTCEGQGRLRIVGVRGDCGCARVWGMPEYVQAGTRGTLWVNLAASARVGPQQVEIRVYTDLPKPRDIVRVRVHAPVGAISEGDPGTPR